MAMQQNDVSNHGIEITYRFASPHNKVQTGPLSRFIMLVNNPAYSPLLNHLDATFLNLKVEGNVAIQEVIITTSKGTRKGFRFLLSLQQGKQFKDCWMTDAVIPFEILEVQEKLILYFQIEELFAKKITSQNKSNTYLSLQLNIVINLYTLNLLYKREPKLFSF